MILGDIVKDVKVIFMGTPDFSVPILKELIIKTNVIAVVTQPDAIVGRKNELVFSSVKKEAVNNNIKVFQPTKIRKEFTDIIALKPDMIITCAYGQIIPKEILDCPKYGCINVHASYLPYLRGGAPIHHAIIDGYKETGVTIMYMNEKMDEGDIISQEKIAILDSDTAASLHDKLSIIGRDLLIETLPTIINGTNARIPQDHSRATYGYNIKREEEKIDFNRTSRDIFNQVRGLNSWPGSYALLNDKILKIWEVELTDFQFPSKENGAITKLYKTGIGVKVADGEIILKVIQPEGKGKMKAIDYINGLKDKEQFVNTVLR